METLLFPLLILLLFIPIFLSGRKQRRQMQEMQQLQAALEPGDVVMTTSGLRGTVVDASYEDTVDLEIADGVVTTWARAAVREKIDPTPDDVSSLTDEDASGSTAADLPAADKTPESTTTADGETGSNGRPDGRS
ncbi:preprotein translocase subunit YajC [Pseudonocardia sp. H11422]|uniref:preprotein translocase subunit YajC n=1 Tax=Pseudonocardia sp. H11422 TaxID=2835866 RepID=UPI001BDD0AF8|nr:preprotein translocase subunit YajC [Pseudonocardia sp. H11422]